MKHIPESDYFKRKKRHKQNTPTLGKIIKIIKTKQSITKQTNNQVNKQTNKQTTSKQTNQQTKICTHFRIQLWYVHRISGVMVNIQ